MTPRLPSSSRSIRLTLLLATALLVVPPAARAQDDGRRRIPVVVEQSAPVTPHVFEGDLRQLPEAPAWKPGDPIRIVPRRTRPVAGDVPDAGDSGRVDPLVEIQRGADASKAPDAFTTPILSFQGIGFSGAQPPDTVGDVGPGHYVQSTNASSSTPFKIWDKSGGALTGNVNMGTLGTGACATSAFGDPIVLYDPMADRWLMSEFASGNRLCVYVSRTPDPVAGGWFAYTFQVPDFPDYPKYSVWPDAYYVTSNESQPAIYALDRTRMLAGQSATFQRFTAPPLAGFPFQALTPADLDGSTQPPAGAPGIMGRHRDDEAHGGSTANDYIDLFELDVDFATPGNSTFTQLPSVAVSDFDSRLCGLSSFSCIDQPNGGTPLDPLREVIMHRFQYRSLGGTQVLVGNLATDVGGDQAGVRWFHLTKSGNSWGLANEGTYSPDGHSRWMAGTSMDQSGNIALAYSVSSLSVFPSIRYTGRLATDGAGVMSQAETSIRAGAASQNGERWGDYSAMGVDPSDDCTFWYTTEYTPTPQWSTWIASFKFDTCGASSGTGVDYVLGQGLGAPNPNRVRVYTSAGAATAVDFLAYSAGAWGTNVSTGEINGGTEAEMLTGPGPGDVFGPQVKAFLAAGTPTKVNFFAYGTLRFGVNVGGGTTDGDAFDEIQTGAGPGDVFGPHVRGWNFDNTAITAIAGINFFAYSTLRYGVNVEEGDLDDDGFTEILTGAGPGPIFGAQVRGWNVDGGATKGIGGVNFFSHSTSGFGVNVAGGDVDGDGFHEIAAVPGPGATHAARFLGFDYDGGPLAALPGFDVTPYGSLYGGRVGLGDLSVDGTWDLITGPGRSPSATAQVRAYSYASPTLTPRSGTPFTPFTGAFGVNVSAGALGF